MSIARRWAVLRRDLHQALYRLHLRASCWHGVYSARAAMRMRGCDIEERRCRDKTAEGRAGTVSTQTWRDQ